MVQMTLFYPHSLCLHQSFSCLVPKFWTTISIWVNNAQTTFIINRNGDTTCVDTTQDSSLLFEILGVAGSQQYCDWHWLTILTEGDHVHSADFCGHAAFVHDQIDFPSWFARFLGCVLSLGGVWWYMCMNGTLPQATFTIGLIFQPAYLMTLEGIYNNWLPSRFFFDYPWLSMMHWFKRCIHCLIARPWFWLSWKLTDVSK